jgi:hypothetical protein
VCTQRLLHKAAVQAATPCQAKNATDTPAAAQLPDSLRIWHVTFLSCCYCCCLHGRLHGQQASAPRQTTALSAAAPCCICCCCWGVGCSYVQAQLSVAALSTGNRLTGVIGQQTYWLCAAAAMDDARIAACIATVAAMPAASPAARAPSASCLSRWAVSAASSNSVCSYALSWGRQWLLPARAAAAAANRKASLAALIQLQRCCMAPCLAA